MKVIVDRNNETDMVYNSPKDFEEVGLSPGETIIDNRGDIWLVTDPNIGYCLVCLTNGLFNETSFENADGWIEFPAYDINIEATLKKVDGPA